MPAVRWLAVALAAAGWVVSLQLLRVSGGASPDAVQRLLCGGGQAGEPDPCTAVLTSPQAYVPLGRGTGAPRIPMAALGMAYFAAVGVWYLFIGPPARRGRGWYLLIVVLVLAGAWASVQMIILMKSELRQWCAGCLVAHGINGGLVLLTMLAYPWRRRAAWAEHHPGARLALATATAAGLMLLVHVAGALAIVTSNAAARQGEQYVKLVGDPEYVRWNWGRQPVADLRLRPDEVFGGRPDALHTAVVFGDFQCTACRRLHNVLMEVAHKYPDRLRVAFRHYPQDPECNPNPKYRAGGHAVACRAARAVEAARIVGGRDAFLAMRQRLWDEQDRLPRVPYARQTAAERGLFEDWAADLGLERTAFTAAVESDAAAERIRADLALAEALHIDTVPIVYLDGRRLVGWHKLDVWDAVLSAGD